MVHLKEQREDKLGEFAYRTSRGFRTGAKYGKAMLRPQPQNPTCVTHLSGIGGLCTLEYRVITEMESARRHIRVRHIWEYVNTGAELSLEDQSHLYTCEICLAAFRICILSKGQPAEHTDEELSA